MEVNVASPSEATLEITVIRCTCGQPDSHAGQPCPRGAAQALGVVAFHTRNPLRRLAWRLSQFWRSITHG